MRNTFLRAVCLAATACIVAVLWSPTARAKGEQYLRSATVVDSVSGTLGAVTRHARWGDAGRTAFAQRALRVTSLSARIGDWAAAAGR
jgi:hypothetical protein